MHLNEQIERKAEDARSPYIYRFPTKRSHAPVHSDTTRPPLCSRSVGRHHDLTLVQPRLPLRSCPFLTSRNAERASTKTPPIMTFLKSPSMPASASATSSSVSVSSSPCLSRGPLLLASYACRGLGVGGAECTTDLFPVQGYSRVPTSRV